MKEQSNNFGNGGGISTSSPYALQKVDNWNQIPSTWKNTNVINKVNFDLNPLDKKFQSIFNIFLNSDITLRSNYNGYNVDDYGITFTNAHILGSIPAKLKDKGIFLPTGEKQDGEYPKYENVIPKSFNHSHKINCYKLLQYCKVGLNYTNETTKQISFRYEDDMAIGFNAEYIIIVLESLLKLGYEDVYMGFNNSNNASIFSPINNPKLGEDIIFLVMPVMLNDSFKNTHNIGAIEIDYNMKMSFVFDITKNEIINKDGSIAEFKMNYGSNPIFTDEVIKILKSSIVKKSSLLILENFKVQDGYAKAFNLKGYSYSVVLKNINVPNGLYYIKNNVAIKNENEDADDFMNGFDNQVQKRNSIKIKKDYFKYLIDTSKLYVGNDELRPTMTGVNLKYDSSDLYLASTNAHFLCRLKVEDKLFFENNNSFDIILPIYNINTLLDNSEDDYVVLDIFTSDYDSKAGVILKIETKEFVLEQMLIDGKYPNYNAVIPQINNFHINLNKESILNAIKSKEAEAFIKKNKKFDIKIAGRKDNGSLSVILYTTDSWKNYATKLEEIEILKTDLHFSENEISTTYSCLLLMPVITNDDYVFAFSLNLFKDFIKPVNTDYFEISFNKKDGANTINEQFFKYKQEFKKPAKQIKTQEFVKPLIQNIQKKEDIEIVKKETPAESKIDNDIFDATKLDLDNPISSIVYYKGVDKEINNFLQNDYNTKYDFDKKGIEWVYKNTRYNVKDEDLISELKETLAERNRGAVDIIRINNELPRIESKYGKDVNLAKKMYQEAKDFYENKLRTEKSIRANDVFIDYLISRLKETKKEETPIETKKENFESSLPEWLKKEFLETSDDAEFQSGFGLEGNQKAMYEKMVTDKELFLNILKNDKKDYESDIEMEKSGGNDYTYLLNDYDDIIKLLNKYTDNKYENKYLENISSKKETPAESKSDLEYLNELLATSNDLLDLISDTGSKADIKFLKEKIEATKDLISLLQ